MPNTVSVESKDFVHPDLIWKTVTKGFRSASRRPRKATSSLSLSVQQDDKSRKREDPSISGLEKHGLSVLGQRFIDKIEHVPIKKRRLQIRPLSPPSLFPLLHCGEALSCQRQTACRQPGGFDRTLDNKRASVQSCSSDSLSAHGALSGSVGVESSQNMENACVNGKLSDVSSGKICYTEDFSGIALLAAAACSNSIIDDDHNVEEGTIGNDILTLEGTDSSLSAMPSERTTTSSESGSLSPKDMAREDNIDCSVAVSKNIHDKREREAAKRYMSKKDDRLHWDLNTVMEAWDLPCDELDMASQRNNLVCIPVVGNDAHSEKPQQLEVSVKHNEPGHSSADKVSTHLVNKDDCLDYSPCLGRNPNLSSSMSDEKITESPINCCTSSAVLLDQMVSVEKFPVQQQGAIPFDQAVSEKVECSSDHIQPKDGSMNTFDVPSCGTAPTELVSSVTCQTTDVECLVSKSGKAGLFHPSPEHEHFSSLGTAFGEGQPIVPVDVEKKQDEIQHSPTVNVEKKQDQEEALIAETASVYSSLQSESKELETESKEHETKSSECFSKVALQDPIGDGYDSNICLGNDSLAVNVEEATEIQVDYESPFEDGELREPVAYSWEDNEVEGRTECMGCDTGSRDKEDLDATNHCVSGVGSASCHNDNNGSSASMQCGIVEVLKESSQCASSKWFSGQDGLSAGPECSSSRIDGGNNDGMQNILACDSAHGLDMQGSSTAEFASRITTRKLSSRVEGLSCTDTLNKKDDVHVQRDRSTQNSIFHSGRTIDSEKNLGRDRSNLQMLDGSKGDIHRAYSPASYLDSRNHYQSGFAQDARHPKIDRLTYRYRGHNYSSKGGLQPPGRRRLPDDSDDAYNADRRIAAPIDNRRGRPGIYRQVVNRGSRDEYHGPISDDSGSSFVHVPRNLSRRDRSFSPTFRRGANFSRTHRKSRSRSRSRSPTTWHWQRERNMRVGRISRSPHLWPEARRERVRMPFQKLTFEADYDDVLMSPKGSRFSPESRSRWFDDQNGVVDPFEEGKLSGRLFRRVPRFDSGGSSGRRKPDDCLRSTARPGRFRRGYQYNGSGAERTKYCNNYEPFDQIRRRDPSDRVRRFRYDGEDCFVVQDAQNEDNSYIRSVGRRDIRSGREERGPFRYNRERTNAIGPKLSAIGDEDEDASPPSG